MSFLRISIHAPREGSDRYLKEQGMLLMDISIHAPREGSDSSVKLPRGLKRGFQSTLPARGATGGHISSV